ncbi:MAG: DNA methyltransferase [Methanothrix sp.]
MPAPQEIVGLVERFRRRINEYRGSLYNETELRNEFVNPFFAALGWDIDNRQDLSSDLKEVKVEESIRVEESIKSPDYSFRLGRKLKFFVETKKPSINIEGGVYPAFQLRRYAWSASLSLSILTDFEEFAVYDCRAEPKKIDKPGKGRLLYLQYDQYVERWDEIAALFSKEAVLAGSLDRYIQAIPEKRGIKRVDAALLDEISQWREALAGNLARRNPHLSQSDLNFAVQRTIDRLLFLRICEDRAIEEYGRLKALLQEDGVYARLMEIFREADRRYNSGIFHFQEERDRAELPDSLTGALVLDDATLKEIIQDLYYPDTPYVFSEIPAEILGQVYEQFLGKVIRLEEGHRAVVEDKPEVRKAGGVYYTPSYIVEYIVKNTVGRLLEGKSAAQAAEVRILDPACGSGSFLIGAYQFLLDWHLQWYRANLCPLLEKSGGAASPEALRLLPAAPERRSDRRARRIAARAAQAAVPIFKDSGGEWRLTTAERKRILQSSIYGVDIDSQAVEVTKLSLLLKVLEGESRESISSLLRYFKERALPDLGENIKCGNSLIGYDYYDDHQKMSDEEARRINAFDWKTGFAEVFERGGFDAVIGNPPYLRIQGLQENFGKQIDYYISHFKSATKRFDMYLLFIENSFNLS